MTPINISVVPMTIKYGVVTVYNEDGTLNRVFRIPAEEVENVNSGKISHPVDVTDDEWYAKPSIPGRAIMSGCPIDVGQALIEKEGTLLVRVTETRLVRAFPGEWEYVDNVLSVTPETKNLIEAKR